MKLYWVTVKKEAEKRVAKRQPLIIAIYWNSKGKTSQEPTRTSTAKTKPAKGEMAKERIILKGSQSSKP